MFLKNTGGIIQGLFCLGIVLRGNMMVLMNDGPSDQPRSLPVFSAYTKELAQALIAGEGATITANADKLLKNFGNKPETVLVLNESLSFISADVRRSTGTLGRLHAFAAFLRFLIVCPTVPRDLQRGVAVQYTESILPAMRNGEVLAFYGGARFADHVSDLLVQMDCKEIERRMTRGQLSPNESIVAIKGMVDCLRPIDIIKS